MRAIVYERYGPAHVTTTSSARNLELCRSLGAQEAWDYAQQTGLSEGAGWDVFFDVFGNRSFGKVRGALGPKGTSVTTVPGPQLVMLHFATRFMSRRARLVVVK